MSDIDLDGLSTVEIAALLKEGKLDGMLGGAPRPAEDVPKTQEWLDAASTEQIAAALRAGELNGLLAGSRDTTDAAEA